jgi:GNAT superfamily N-acetyltransferase
MDRNSTVGVVRRQGLTGSEPERVRDLLALCNRHEGLDLAVNLASAGEFPGVTIEQFLYYQAGVPVGFWSIDPANEPETCGMVHPAHRRRGIGRALLEAARAACREKGIPRWLLVCEEASRSGKAFVNTLGARHRGGEYRMELDVAAIPELPPVRDALSVTPAAAEDVEAVVRVRAARGWSGTEEESRQRITREMEGGRHRIYLGRLNGEPIGTLTLAGHGDSVYLIAFRMLPEHRGKGYGRQMLMDAVRRLLAEKWERLLIEVATDNPVAHGLYRSCGFRERTCYGFYEMAI